MSAGAFSGRLAAVISYDSNIISYDFSRAPCDLKMICRIPKESHLIPIRFPMMPIGCHTILTGCQMIPIRSHMNPIHLRLSQKEFISYHYMVWGVYAGASAVYIYIYINISFSVRCTRGRPPYIYIYIAFQACFPSWVYAGASAVYTYIYIYTYLFFNRFPTCKDNAYT